MSQVFHDLTEYPIAETTRKVYRNYLDRLAALAAQERTIYGYRDAAWNSTMSDGLLRMTPPRKPRGSRGRRLLSLPSSYWPRSKASPRAS